MQEAPETPRLSPWELFRIFFKAGCAFGGGLGILSLLEPELVQKRGVATRHDLLAAFSLGRIVPSGTMTALAVGFGWRYAGFPGTVAALVGMILPAFTLTVLLTMLYDYLRGSPIFELFPVTIVPAALAFIAASALQLGREVFKPAPELAIAVIAFLGVVGFHLSPVVAMLIGGVVGVVLIGRWGKEPGAAGGGAGQ